MSQISIKKTKNVNVNNKKSQTTVKKTKNSKI